MSIHILPKKSNHFKQPGNTSMNLFIFPEIPMLKDRKEKVLMIEMTVL